MEKDWGAYWAAQLRAAAPPQAPAAVLESPPAFLEEMECRQHGQGDCDAGPREPERESAERDVDDVLAFLEEMECRQHGQGDLDAAPQRPERESAKRDVKSKRDRGT